jgi:hypothetical protein
VRKGLLAGTAVAFVWAAIVYVVGSVTLHVGGAVIRSREPFRALVLGSALLVVQAIWFRAAFTHDLDRLLGVARRLALPLAVAAGGVLLAIGLRFGTFAAGSADSYGYVNQAYGWASRELPRTAPVMLLLPWPDADMVQSPLGYRPGPVAHTLVPTYAPGLPLMMAAALRVVGPLGPFLIVPACGVILTWLSFVWGRRADGPLTGLLAALLVVTSPIVVFQTLWPMSDVPAAALWTAAAVASLGTTRGSAIGAGLCTAAGLLVRPNLPLVALVPLVQVAMAARGRERWIRAALAASPIALVAAVVAALNSTWYGAPSNTGYGGTGELYSFARIGPNLARYPVWLWQSHSGWVLLGLVPLVPRLRAAGTHGIIRLAYLLVLATLASYIAYYPFDEWWYLRFLLPAAGAAAVLVAVGIATLARRMPVVLGRIAATAVVLWIVLHTTTFSSTHGTFGLIKASERRYVDVGAYLARALPENALVFTMQHSGAVRFYGGRYSLRYDFLHGNGSTRIPELERLGYHAYLVIDDWEAPYVRAQFGMPTDARLPWPLVARTEVAGGVSVFDLASAPVPVSPVAIAAGGSPLAPPRRPLITRPRAGP